jgi:hypothetical protein
LLDVAGAARVTFDERRSSGRQGRVEASSPLGDAGAA